MVANYDQEKKEVEDEVEKFDEEVDDNANETVSTASSLGTYESNNIEWVDMCMLYLVYLAGYTYIKLNKLSEDANVQGF